MPFGPASAPSAPMMSGFHVQSVPTGGGLYIPVSVLGVCRACTRLCPGCEMITGREHNDAVPTTSCVLDEVADSLSASSADPVAKLSSACAAAESVSMCTQRCALLCSCLPEPGVDPKSGKTQGRPQIWQNPGQTSWVLTGTQGNPRNTREPREHHLLTGT